MNDILKTIRFIKVLTPYFHRANRPSSFDDMVGYLEALLLDNEYWDEPISSDYKFKEIEVNQEMSNKVFIVHGHDTSAKESMARTLEKLVLKQLYFTNKQMLE